MVIISITPFFIFIYINKNNYLFSIFFIYFRHIVNINVCIFIQIKKLKKKKKLDWLDFDFIVIGNREVAPYIDYGASSGGMRRFHGFGSYIEYER